MSSKRQLPLDRVQEVARPTAIAGVMAGGLEALGAAAMRVIEKPPELSWRDWAVFLLHASSEVEHALLVEYLYAAWSLRRGLTDPTNPAQTTNSWRRMLLGIAKEEMGHLLTVQNILAALGGPLNFEREDFPFRSNLYPFPFQLERLSRMSLAKYVLAEMPPEGVPETLLSAEEQRRIVELAAAGNSGEGINQVGLLYDTLRHALAQIPADAFRADPPTGPRYQSGQTDWQNRTTENPAPSNPPDIKTLIVRDQVSALVAVDVIAQQGEGAGPSDLAGSHFQRFLDLFRAFPPENATWTPTYPVVTDPNTRVPADATTISHPVTRRWALLFNSRYRILLLSLSQALHETASTDRDLLIDWVYEEMSDSLGALGALAGRLVQMDVDELSGRKAGPPFELPYSLALPNRPQDRWRMQLDLIDGSRQIIDVLINPAVADPVLDDILQRDGRTADDGRRAIIATKLASFPSASAGEIESPTFESAQSAKRGIPMIGYLRVKEILDEAVNGENFGSHGPFWRGLTRDQFIAKSIFGRKLIALKVDGSFDPDESNLIKALEGRAPFGDDLQPPTPGAIFPRMPLGFPPLSAERIQELRGWISGGCPEQAVAPNGWIDDAAGGPLTDASVHLNFWRDFDNWAMFQATPQTSADINVLFAAADKWMAFARDSSQLSQWQTELARPELIAAVSRLEQRQRETVVNHYGRPVPLLTLLDSFERFGDDSLPNDVQRPQDVRHSMNGRSMWFFWSAFADACLRLDFAAGIPAEFWNGMSRAILIGLMNDGLFRGRFAVVGFDATPQGRQALRQHVTTMSASSLQQELVRRFVESGLA